MANKLELLQEMDRQIGELRQTLDDVARRIASHTQEITVAQAGRRQSLQEHTMRLLPSLDPAAIQALSRVVPNSVTVEGVAAMCAQVQATARAQMERLAERYDPATYGVNRGYLETMLSVARETLESDRLAMVQKNDIPGLDALVASGYGTDAYPHHWWSIQFYRDWEASDLAVEMAQAADWETLRRAYLAVVNAVTTRGQEVERLQRELHDLDTDRTTWDDLAAVQSHPAERVLEDLRVKLASWLDGQDPSVVPMPAVAAQNERIAALQQAITTLHITQAGLYRALATLEENRARIVRARVQQVPDGFVDALQQYRRQAGGYGWVASPPWTTAYEVDAMNSFFTGVLWEQMNDYFVPQVAYEQGYADGSSSESSGWSGVDTSIQS